MVRKKLQGQVAIVTGAGRGIGAATARLFAQAGAAVVLTARSQDQLERVAQAIQQDGGRAIPVPGDVSDFDQVEEVVEAALTQFDRVDILVNNAGILWPIDETAEADPDEWAYNIHVNLVGAFNMVRNVLPVMLDQQYGRIVNMSSGAAENPVPGWSAYCAAKAGLEMFTRVTAQELEGTGVTSNALRPGIVDTEMQADIRSVDTTGTRLDFSRYHEVYRTRQGMFTPDEVARLLFWMVGPWGQGYNGVIFSARDAAWRAQVEKAIA